MLPGRDGGREVKEGGLFNVQPMSKWDTILKKKGGGGGEGRGGGGFGG